MTTFLWTAASGWLAMLVLASATAMPFALRAMGTSSQWLGVHYGLGVAVPAAATLHAWLPMGTRMPLHQASLLVATVALFGLVWQVAMGAGLRLLKGFERRRTRRLHLWGMFAIALLTAAHVGLERFG
jgi:hypothetical protein